MHFLVRLLLTEKNMFTLYHSNINSFYLHYKQTYFIYQWCTLNLIFPLQTGLFYQRLYFKSCSWVLTTLIFFMGRMQNKGKQVLYAPRSLSVQPWAQQDLLPCQALCMSEILGRGMRGRCWGDSWGFLVMEEGGLESSCMWVRQRGAGAWATVQGSSSSQAPSARAPSHTNVISFRTQHVCTNKPPRPRSGNYCPGSLSRTKLSVQWWSYTLSIGDMNVWSQL